MNQETVSDTAKKLENKLRALSGASDYICLEPLDEACREQILSAFKTFQSERKPIETLSGEIIVSLENKTLEKIPRQPAVILAAKKQLEEKQDVRKNPENLDSLKLSYFNCANCDLSLERKTIVFGQGNQKAELLFIGEGPGEEEDNMGLAFVGKAGKLLTQIIQSIGISRNSVYICNVVKCRPPGNRNPTSQEMDACLPILKRQISLIQPKLIVTLGNIATKALIPDASGIMKMRGTLIRYDKFPLIPTFHPSYLLRNSRALSLVWDDMKQIRQYLFKTTKNDPSRTHQQEI
ncbi:MAG: uracil-DNA glycosylase [Deltaproteobacteria bacterium]|nr:uracil-DNA glycosylase [Deltaproteobacteria bacterium]